MKKFRLEKMFDASFEKAMNRQMEVLQELKKDRSGSGLLLLCEHKPLVTMGRNGSENNLLNGQKGLKMAGIEYSEARRGGDVTYHGPGQITVYPVFPLEWWERDLHRYLRRLEELGIRYLSRHGIQAHREQGLTGVWTFSGKVAAVGIAVSNWICFYGTGINIQPDFNHFALIRPCGIEDRPVSSLNKITGKTYDIDHEMDAIAEVFLEVFDDSAILDCGLSHIHKKPSK